MRSKETRKARRDKDLTPGRYTVKGSWLYKFGRFVCRLYCTLMFNVVYDGLGNIPRDTNFIVISNHINSWDPFLIAIKVRDRAIHFLAKESLFRNPLLARVLRKAHMLKVSKDGVSNLSTMRSSLGVIRAGGTVGIFPEGHRIYTGKLGGFKSGVAMLVMHTDVPLLPVHISGEYGFRKTVSVRFGEILTLSDLRALPKDADALSRVNDRLINIVDKLALPDGR